MEGMPTLIFDFWWSFTARWHIAGRVFNASHIISHIKMNCTHAFYDPWKKHLRYHRNHGNLFPRGFAFLRIESLKIIFYRIDFSYFSSITNSMLYTFSIRCFCQVFYAREHKRRGAKGARKYYVEEFSVRMNTRN